MGSTYTSRALPAEVLVDGADMHLVRRRRSPEAMMQEESLPPPLLGDACRAAGAAR